MLDVLYAPWPTPLAQRVTAVGGTVAGGLEVLFWQATAQVELMTGRPAPIAAMRERPRRRRPRRPLDLPWRRCSSLPCSSAVVGGPWLARVAARLAARDEPRARTGGRPWW